MRVEIGRAKVQESLAGERRVVDDSLEPASTVAAAVGWTGPAMPPASPR
jgi:hypothetical protein